MSKTEAQKRATTKWNKANTKNVACALSLGQYKQFKRYAEQHGKTVTGMVKSLVLDCISEMEQTDILENLEQPKTPEQPE